MTMYGAEKVGVGRVQRAGGPWLVFFEVPNNLTDYTAEDALTVAKQLTMYAKEAQMLNRKIERANKPKKAKKAAKKAKR